MDTEDIVPKSINQIPSYNHLLNVEFNWDKNGLASAEPIQVPPPQIDHVAVTMVIGKMEKWQVAPV